MASEELRTQVEFVYKFGCWILGLIFIAILYLFGIGFLEPTFSIESFYVPALSKISNDTVNPFIFFDLQLYNPNEKRIVHYNPLDVTVSYGRNKSSPILLPNVVGNVSFPGLNLEALNTVHRIEMVSVTGIPWETARQKVMNGTAVFQVDLKTKVRYEKWPWKTRKYKIRVGSDVRVNDEGRMVRPKNKGVMLSAASVHVGNFAHVAGLVCFVLLFLWS
ncbi:hypothetical protein AQUCO_05500137v1 [Aquilegia coerulea]|uniref:Late embryogenesis abundant protein LEA-2 subgroup domain-containing protein n=1 Tax=Aquilegia coerulea TaxID=218851 RepID=A0A2G5CH70_AQUCA|nr:hypothetical protein AQUCO_05500137v1 [Aquilegia coerulea]